jgi:hypothetical protein
VQMLHGNLLVVWIIKSEYDGGIFCVEPLLFVQEYVSGLRCKLSEREDTRSIRVASCVVMNEV